jgi:prepilin-type processing-associated H-X9-DG protein
MKKHLKRMNVVYIDGHARASKGSQLRWGQWYRVFSGTTITGTSKKVDGPVSNDALDNSEIKPD